MDPTFTAVLRAMARGEVMTDWKITGPLHVDRNPEARTAFARDDELIEIPETSGHVQLNLMPEVAAAVLRLIGDIAEAAPSRTGRSRTYRLKKKAPSVGIAVPLGAKAPIGTKK